MEGFKSEPHTKEERLDAVKKGMRIAVLMSALGGVFGSAQGAQVHSPEKFPYEDQGNVDAQEDVSEGMEDTVEGILQKAIEGKEIAVVEANAVRYAWEEATTHLPEEVTTGEYGQTMEEMLKKLDVIARLNEENSLLKGEFAVLAEKLTALEKEPEIIAMREGVDQFVEEDSNAVEYLSEDR